MSRPPARAPFDLDTIGQGLPFAEVATELVAVLEAGGAGATAVVQAPPGSGKTTLVPPIAADVARRRANAGDPPARVVVTQPRRVAARAAARRLAQLDGSALGDRIGFAIGGERKAGPHTTIEFVTPGILLRRLLADPALEGVAAVVLDEVHERNLDTDLLIGLFGEVRQLRDDLSLVAMSATLDAGRYARLLGASGSPAPIVASPAVLHSLEVRWVPGSGPRLDERGVVPAFLDHVADTAAAAHAEARVANPGADALVFLPGAREVSRVAERLRARMRGVEVLQLEGRASTREQDRAVSGRDAGDQPRIVVSTAIAESSLTVPGVRVVVDAGLARVPKRDAARGMTGLVTVSASRASCEQRAGRAARQGPGLVVRCFDERAFASAPAHPQPELASADLVDAALVLACWGAPGGQGLDLPDPFPAAALADAVEVLRELGAVDLAGRATQLGHRLVAAPTDPRLARALLEAAPAVGARAAAEAVAIVSGDLRIDGGDLDRAFRDVRRGVLRLDGRMRGVVDRLERHAERAVGRGGAVAASGAVASTRVAASRPPGEGVEPPRVSNEHGAGRPVASSGTGGVSGTGGFSLPGIVVALAFPSRIARLADAASSTYLLASGTRAALEPASSLRGEQWLAVAEVTRAGGRAAAGTGAVIRSAARLDEGGAEFAASHLVTDRVEATFVDGRVITRRERRLGAIVRSSTPVASAAAKGGHAAVERALIVAGLDAIGWSQAAATLRNRLGLIRRELGDPWPDVVDNALLTRLDEWLAPEIDALAHGTPASRINLTDPLRRLLPWPEAARLDELAPERLEVPSGSRVRIDYPAPGDDGRPVVAVKLQECFGWAETPRLVDGRVPVLFHLLSPAARPVAVTDDLASFWSGPYAQVRAELRGRYPKHPWPEDPWTAPPTSRTKQRM